MTDPKTKTKDVWGSWRNKPYAVSAGAEDRRRQADKWSALAEFIRRHGGAVVSIPGNKTLRIEIAKDRSAQLTKELVVLNYVVIERGSTTRVVGAGPSDPRTERMTGVTASPFLEVDVLEIRTDGR
jgi:hypothetical protein